MDPEDLDTEADAPESSLSGGLSSAALAQQYQQQQRLVQDQIRNNMQILQQAQERLRAQRVGPSSAEQLFAISAALLQPTRTRGLSGTLANLSNVMGEQEKARREAEAERAALLDKYGAQIGGEQLRMLQTGLAGTGTLLGRAMAAETAAARAKKRRTAISPVDGRIYDLDTGEVVEPAAAEPAAPAVGEIRKGYRFLGGDPKLPASWQKVQ